MDRDSCYLARLALKSSVAERWREVKPRDRVIGTSNHRAIEPLKTSWRSKLVHLVTELRR